MRLRWGLIVLVMLGWAAPVGAQTPAGRDLLALVPQDFAVCLSVQDLRGNWQRLEQAAWVKALKESPVGQGIVSSPEFRGLQKFQVDLKEHLDIDWPTIRDEILGDSVVFAYRPAGAFGGSGEQGLFLTVTRQPELLGRLVNKLNDLQKQVGELQTLEARAHQGVTYYRRVLDKNTHFYLLQDSLFVLASNESAMRSVIERRGETAAPIRQALRRADADRAWLALWVNPRAFDAEVKAKAENAQGPEKSFLGGVAAHWRTLDGVVAVLDLHKDVELRLTLLFQASELPLATKTWLTRSGAASELWQRFPKQSIFVFAGRTDFRAAADRLVEAAPAELRKVMVEAVVKNARGALGLDLFEDVLPNLGPDWGVCVLPASAGKEFPQALVALAVKPGKGNVGVDKALYRSIEFFAGLALFEYNRTHTDSEPIRIQTQQLDGVEVKYLSSSRVFPAGLQPACAMKDGYLHLATSPAAIAQFQRRLAPASATEEVPLLRFAPAELAQLVRLHRDHVLGQIMKKNNQGKAAAERDLDGLLTLLDLCQNISLSQRSSEDRLQWILRGRMGKSETP